MLVIRLRRRLCFLAAALVALGAVRTTPSTAAPDAAPDAAPVSRAAVQDVLEGLASRHAAERGQALRDLATLISLDARVGVRALPRLRTVLRTGGPAERALAAPLLVRIPDGEAREAWLRILDPEKEDDAVLAAAVGATRQVPGDTDLLRRLLDVIRSERSPPCRRALAIEALGGMDGPAVDVVLGSARAGETWVEASARALALGRRRSPRSIPPLLALLEHEKRAPQVHAWESLVALTHRDLPMAAGPWKAWWASRDPSQLPGPPEPAQAGPRYAAPKPIHVPHYYGIPIPRPASHVVFCLDVSQSMYGAGIDDARQELARTLMDFPSTHAFEIIVFNEKVRPWSTRLVRSHPVQKFRAIRWLAEVEPTSYTNLYDALELAFGHTGRGPRAVEVPVELDAIFLLSDGAPNRGRHRTHDRVVKHVGRLSRRDVPVHTVGAGEEVFPLLRAIAHETGGTFVDAFE
jgi:HEAT repeat protein